MGERVKKLLVATMLLLPFAAFQSADAVEKIRDVTSAGLTCSSAPATLGPRFHKYATRACKGRAVCIVKATNVTGSKRLKSYGCTDFYVVTNCGSQNKEVRAKDVREKLRVGC